MRNLATFRKTAAKAIEISFCSEYDAERLRTLENDDTILANEIERDVEDPSCQIPRKGKIVEERRWLWEIEESGGEGVLDCEIPRYNRLEPDLQELVGIALRNLNQLKVLKEAGVTHREDIRIILEHL